MTLDDANPKGAVQATATLAVDVRSDWEQMLQALATPLHGWLDELRFRRRASLSLHRAGVAELVDATGLGPVG